MSSLPTILVASPGTGFWNDTNDSLRLWVVQDTEAGSEYIIRFSIYNPPNAQLPAEPTILAEDVGNSKDIWHDGYDIIARKMDYPTTLGSDDLEDPMKVIETTFTFIQVASSDSKSPCDNRTITITFQMDVPVWKRCKPIWTFTGFQEAYAHVGGLGFGVHGAHDYILLGGAAASSFAPVRTDDHTVTLDTDFDTDARIYAEPCNNHNESIAGYGSWTNYRASDAESQLDDQFQDRTLKLFVNRTLHTGVDYSFSFTVVNPAKGQAATAVSMKAVGQPMLQRRVFDTMEVLASKFEVRTISQSSPWPCDENLITVGLVSNSPLFRSCQSDTATSSAGITISGLTGTMAPTTERSYITIGFTDSSLGPYNATWNSTTGTLTIRVIDILIQAGLQDVEDLTMSFKVVNKATRQLSPDIFVTHRITNDVDEGGEGTVEKTEAMLKNTQPITFQQTVSLLSSVGSSVGAGDGDGEPMRIREAKFDVKTITQSSPYPCDDNNIIHVTLQNSVPLISGHCSHSITIKGLKHYWTPDNMQMNFTVDNVVPRHDVDDVFGLGVWNQDNGSLTIKVKGGQIMVAGKEYVLSLKLHNPGDAKTSFTN